MWKQLAKFVLKNRLVIIILLVLSTGVMGYFASKVKLSYEFSRALPKNDSIYIQNTEFKKMFGDDGNMMVIGIQDKHFFDLPRFSAYQQLCREMKQVNCVEEVLSIPSTVYLEKDTLEEKLLAKKVFKESYATQMELDSAVQLFLQLPFYRSMLHNPDSAAYLMAVKINKDSLNSPARVKIAQQITTLIAGFSRSTKQDVKISGLPWIRTNVAEMIQKEMKIFLIGSVLLSILILLLFFRSVGTTLISMSIVLISVIWAVALIQLCGYRITLLTALIPSLVVVIGIPNCIYFINKYHTSFLASSEPDPTLRKHNALVDMVSKMGVVTLFCNITAAIGFAVFALTDSDILKEFGVVSGIAIMLIFVISFLLLPAILSYLPSPKKAELKYLNNKFVGLFLDKIEVWVYYHRKTILVITGIISVFAIIGITRLQSRAFIVDDLPKTDKIYTDLKFFEKNFKGIMPLEILIDTKKRRGVKSKGMKLFNKVDSLSMYIASRPEMNRPLSVSEGLKFATQGYNGNDSVNYRMPSDFEAVFMMSYLNQKKSGDSTQKSDNLGKMMTAFIDTSKRYMRISVSMADVGTEQLPVVLGDINKKANELFDTSYNVKLTGTSITFLAGSKFIIDGLKESIFWAFLLIAVCMLYLFRSVKILVCSLLPNLIPLLVTAGIMGWVGVPLKPSTVLIFSIALGIAVDITIRFLINYRQVLPDGNNDVETAVRATVQQTGLSIIYTSLVLTAGFVIFCASNFGGTFALGWLTSVTLFVATLTNIIFLPVLLLTFFPNKSKKS